MSQTQELANFQRQDHIIAELQKHNIPLQSAEVWHFDFSHIRIQFAGETAVFYLIDYWFYNPKMEDCFDLIAKDTARVNEEGIYPWIKEDDLSLLEVAAKLSFGGMYLPPSSFFSHVPSEVSCTRSFDDRNQMMKIAIS